MQAILSQYAPIAVHGLYERDARQPYCQPALWLAPYNNLISNSTTQPTAAGGAAGVASATADTVGSSLVSAAAIVQALLFGEDDDALKQVGLTNGCTLLTSHMCACHSVDRGCIMLIMWHACKMLPQV